MACDSATCGSSSCGSQEACCAPQKKHTGSQLVFCVKCKEGVVARVVANQSEPMCLGCLHASLLSKFKTAINNHSLVTPSDNVLLAFSGGPASRFVPFCCSTSGLNRVIDHPSLISYEVLEPCVVVRNSIAVVCGFVSLSD
jgi:hypothetical protein